MDTLRLGNDELAAAITLDRDHVPALSELTTRATGDTDWAAVRGSGASVGPAVEVAGDLWTPRTAPDAEATAGETEVHFSLQGKGDLAIRHHLQVSPDKPVLTSWTELTNEGDAEIAGITRFDALNITLGVSEAAPLSAYVLGWLHGPRAEAPGRPTVPFDYPSWIPRLLYGQPRAPMPVAPESWTFPVLRLVRERLTRLPLRSGGRSTYENHPWVTVLDPQRQAGFYVGYRWSGSWKMDLCHAQELGTVSCAVSTDGSSHTLRPGESLTSPKAFLGFFNGDWDDGFNACRRYVADEILPPPSAADLPIGVGNHAGTATMHLRFRKRHDPAAMLRAEVAASAEAGMARYVVDANWWSLLPRDDPETSHGLGDFTDNRDKFPMGLKGLSDLVHEHGMKFGLWFEFERVDLRTAGLGRSPWRPEWLVHQKGYPYRSWCQHAFCLCLGVRAAAAWALDNISWGLAEYGVDQFYIDSNEWAVCDDATHDHGAGDGEWAQVHGLYWVLERLRRRFPDLLVENCAGGSQRADFGMAQYCNWIAVNDIHVPSSINRQYGHGLGCMYPGHAIKQSFKPYGLDGGPKGGDEVSPERLEWRALCRLLGHIVIGHWELSETWPDHLAVLRRVARTHGRIRRALDGDRYVLGAQPLIEMPDKGEPGEWEAYEFVAREGDLAAVLVYRTLNPRPDFQVILRGLEAQATYDVEYHSGRSGSRYSGAQLMDEGIRCHLERPRSAEVMILTRAR